MKLNLKKKIWGKRIHLSVSGTLKKAAVPGKVAFPPLASPFIRYRTQIIGIWGGRTLILPPKKGHRK